MRRKDIVISFKEVFSEFLTQKGYVFCKDCFAKYHNGVINLIGIYSRKQEDTVAIDLMFCSEDISQVFLDDVTMENEDYGYRLSQVAYHKTGADIHAIHYWEYALDNPKEPQETLTKMLGVLQESFDTYFNPVDIKECNMKRQRYDDELFDYTEPDEYELLLNVFTHTPKDDFGIPLNRTIKAYKDLLAETLTEIKQLYFDFCETAYQEGFDDIDYLKWQSDAFSESRELLGAFVNDDFEFVSRFARAREKEEAVDIKTNTENNLVLLKKYNLI